MTSGRVLVTGANGFIGRALTRELGRRRIECRLAVRCQGASESSEAVAVGDLGVQADWAKAVSGCDAVVHLAGLAHAPRAAIAEARTVNVGATRRLAEQAASVGARRIVYLSSIKVLGEQTAGAPFIGREAPRPEDDYARIKHEAETALGDTCARSGVECVILRPPLVYGPGVKANFLALLRAIDRGWPLPLAAVRNRRSLIYVGNLVDAIIRCLESAPAAGKTYVVSDGAPVSTPDLVRALAGSLGRPARLFAFPPRLLEIAGTFVARNDTVKRVTRSLEIDDRAIRRELGWRPPFSFEEGIRLTVEWFKKERAARGG